MAYIATIVNGLILVNRFILFLLESKYLIKFALLLASTDFKRNKREIHINQLFALVSCKNLINNEIQKLN